MVTTLKYQRLPGIRLRFYEQRFGIVEKDLPFSRKKYLADQVHKRADICTDQLKGKVKNK